MSELTRSNKITAYWEGEGVAAGIYYKTHDKLLTVRSNDDAVIAAGFKMPEGTDEAPVTASQKLEAFKTFLGINSAVFGIGYDPVDRRADDFKFPGKYDQATFTEFSVKMIKMAIESVLESVQKNVIDKMASQGHIPTDSVIQYGVGEPEITIEETYANGNLKYAKAVYPVAFAVGGKQVDISGTVDLVSGQLKKPRELGEVVLTMTGIKNLLIENSILPKIEKEVKEDTATADNTADATEEAVVDKKSKK